MQKVRSSWILVFVSIAMVSGKIDAYAQKPLPAIITKAPVFITELQMEFLDGIYDTYRSGNSVKDDGCLDFEGGFQSTLDFLRSKIGARYNDEYGFSGFDFKFVSELSQADPPDTPDVLYEKTISMGITSGKHVMKLYDSAPPYFGQPWIFASVQSRDCHSVIDGVSTHRVEVFDYSVVAYLLPILQGSVWSIQFQSAYSNKPSRQYPDSIITRTDAQVKGEFQIPELRDFDMMFDSPGWEGWGEDSSTLRGSAQGKSKLTVSAGNVFTRNMFGRLEPTEKCQGRVHSMPLNLKIYGGAYVRPGWSFVTLLFRPNPGSEKKWLELRCVYLDTGRPSGGGIDHYAIKPVGGDIIFRIGINVEHFADTYAITRFLLNRYKEWGWTYDPLKDPPLPEETRYDFQLDTGSFYLDRDGYTGSDTWKVNVKLERHFSQTIYDQPVKYKYTN